MRDAGAEAEAIAGAGAVAAGAAALRSAGSGLAEPATVADLAERVRAARIGGAARNSP